MTVLGLAEESSECVILFHTSFSSKINKRSDWEPSLIVLRVSVGDLRLLYNTGCAGQQHRHVLFYYRTLPGIAKQTSVETLTLGAQITDRIRSGKRHFDS